jgi:hypothetical protein
MSWAMQPVTSATDTDLTSVRRIMLRSSALCLVSAAKRKMSGRGMSRRPGFVGFGAQWI